MGAIVPECATRRSSSCDAPGASGPTVSGPDSEYGATVPSVPPQAREPWLATLTWIPASPRPAKMTSSGLAIATERSQRFSASTSMPRRAEARIAEIVLASAEQVPHGRDGLRPGGGERHDAGVRRVVRVGGEQDLAGRHVGEAAAEVVERGRAQLTEVSVDLRIEPPTTSVSGSPDTTARSLSLVSTSWSDFAGRSKRRCWRSVPSLSTRASRPSESNASRRDRRGHPQRGRRRRSGPRGPC